MIKVRIFEPHPCCIQALEKSLAIAMSKETMEKEKGI